MGLMKSSTYLVQKILFDLFSTQINLTRVWLFFRQKILLIEEKPVFFFENETASV